MELMEAIKGRRSIGRVKPDEVERALIEQMLEAAVWAPNHHLTEPWRFIVMTGEGRRALGDAYAAVARATAEPEQTAEQRDKHIAKALRAPVVIAVAASPSDNASVPQIEELAAVHAAVQNMLLVAHALGLGAIWRSGAPTYHPLMQAAFGLQPQEQLVGFIYVGYPAAASAAGGRTAAASKTVWLSR